MERLARRRRRRAVRGIGVLLVVAAAVTFVVQNDKSVPVHFWFFTGHPRVIWVVLISLVVGLVIGLRAREPGPPRLAPAPPPGPAAGERGPAIRAVTVVDGDLRWEEHPDPEPADTGLVVAVRAAGVNAADLMQRHGLYPAPAGWPPDVPGMELAGEVVAVGRRARRFAVGDRVMALVGGGAQAELCALDEATAMAVPPDVPWPEAGGFPEIFATAYDALCTQCAMSLGDRVLVTGAAGGVGSAAVQLAAATGARCVASVRRQESRPAVQALGAVAAADPEEALGLGPFDVALELVGAPSITGVLGAMASGGRISVIGVGGGAQAEIDLLTVMQRRLRVHGSTLRARSPEEKAMVVAAVEAHVVPLLAAGRLRVPVAATVPLDRATEAYERFGRSGKVGKIVLVAGR